METCVYFVVEKEIIVELHATSSFCFVHVQKHDFLTGWRKRVNNSDDKVPYFYVVMTKNVEDLSRLNLKLKIIKTLEKKV